MTSSPWVEEALRNTRPAAFWPHQSGAPEAAERLIGRHPADLVVIGGGFTGL